MRLHDPLGVRPNSCPSSLHVPFREDLKLMSQGGGDDGDHLPQGPSQGHLSI